MKNETFYVVAATIIPVYFLALTLQGAFYEKFQHYVESGIEARDAIVVNAVRKTLEKGGRKFTFGDLTDEEMPDLLIDIFRAELIKIVSVLLTIVVVWPTFGEGVALIALYNSKASLWQNIVVESSVLLLVVATACIILARLYAPYYTLPFRLMKLTTSYHLKVALSRRNKSSHELSASSVSEMTSGEESEAEMSPSEKDITPAVRNAEDEQC